MGDDSQLEQVGRGRGNLAGKVALVTGARGFIGSRLCEALVREGVHVHAVVRHALPETMEGLDSHRLCLTNAKGTSSLFRAIKPDLVFHLAGYVTGSRDIEHVEPALSGNLVATVNLLTAAAEFGCERMFMAGSQEEPDGDGVLAADCVPTSPYAATKYAASCFARMYRELYQVPVTVGRIFMTYGPGQRDLRKLIPYTILSLLAGEAPKVGAGSRPMDWIYVDDLIEGMLLVMRPDVACGTVDLGTGTSHTTAQAVEIIAELIGGGVRPEFGAVADRQMEVIRQADVAATEKLLSWRAGTTFREGLAQSIDWYRHRADSLQPNS